MKKIISVVCAVLSVAALSACTATQTDETAVKPGDSATTQVSDSAQETTEKKKQDETVTSSVEEILTGQANPVDENGYFDIYATSTEECAAAILFSMTSDEDLAKLDPSFNATEMADVVIDGKDATLYYIVYEGKTVSKMCVSKEGDYYFCDDVSTPDGTYYRAFSSTKGWVIDKDNAFNVE